MTTELDTEHRKFLRLLRIDLRDAAQHLSSAEVRYLVDTYYQLQEFRKASVNQASHVEEPNILFTWFGDELKALENEIKRAMFQYAGSNAIGAWTLAIKGLGGGVLAAGLLAYIDPERITKTSFNTAGKIHQYSGLNPDQKKVKGKKINWNPRMKLLCWKIGECLIKQCNRDDSFYGPLYKKRKEYEQARSDNGDLAEDAARILTEKNWDKTTDAYKAYIQGKFPPAHIHAKARRWLVKLFLSHWQEIAYWVQVGERAPQPYAMAQLGHADYISPPDVPW